MTEEGPKISPRVRASWALTCVLIAVSLYGCGGEPTRSERLNLVVLVLDTQRPDHLGCYGYPRPTSPNLDAFAREAIVFERVESASPWTAPSLLSLMTSLYPEVHGVVGFPSPGRMSDSITTLAEQLTDHGYRTAAFTEGGYAKGAFGLDQGFETFPKNPGDDERHDSNLWHPSRLAANVERSLDWLRQNAGERFFLLFHTYEPHVPYRAPQSQIGLFRPGYSAEEERAELGRIFERWRRDRSLRETDWARLVAHTFHCFLEELPSGSEDEELRAEVRRLREEVRSRREPFSGETVEYHRDALELVRDLYDAEVRYTDEQLSRLLRELEALGLDDSTLVVVLSDHGEGLGQHGIVEHGRGFYEEQLRIVLLMRIPGESAGRRIPELVRSVDVMPTLLDLLDVPHEELLLQGQSLLPLLRQVPESRPAEHLAYSGAPSLSGEERLWHSVRTARWRYTEDRGSGRSWLFDLDVDPHELRNLASSRPEVTARLRERLAGQRQANAELREIFGASDETELDAETREQLRSLGYID